jgi:hypothetical protein
LRGRPRGRLAAAKTLPFCTCFAPGFGGRPRFAGFCAVSLALFFEWPEDLDFFAKTICN